jgi:uncharacterized RDD family membrane protein YckC
MAVSPQAAVAPKGESSELVVLPIKGEGVSQRFSAIFIDGILTNLVYFAVMALLWLLGGGLARLSQVELEVLSGFYSGAMLLLLPIIWFLYFLLFEGTVGATPGKLLCSLRVIKKEGGRIGWDQAAIRALFAVFEDNPIGALAIWLTPNHQRLGDLLAGTLVVNREKVHKVEFKPPAITFIFHDYRRVDLARIQEGTVSKFGQIRDLRLRGQSPAGKPLALSLHGLYFRPEFDLLRHNIEHRYGLHFPERIIFWRLALAMITVLLLLVVLTTTLISSGLIPAPGFLQPPQKQATQIFIGQATDEDLPAAIARDTRQPAATLEPTRTQIPAPTATPLPVEVNFDTIGETQVGQQVILVGRLDLMSSTICRLGACGLLLENPQNRSQKITIFVWVGTEPNQMKPLPDPYTKSDIQVRLNEGAYAVVGYRLRVTGRRCETTSQAPCISEITKIELFQVGQQNPAPATEASSASPTDTQAASPPDSGTGTAEGRILWNSRPMMGVTVKLCADWRIIGGCKTEAYTAVSGEDGTYRIEGLPAGAYDFATRLSGSNRETGWLGMQVTVTAGQTTNVEDVNIVKSDLEIITPANRATVTTSTPTLKWKAYPEAAYYKVYVSDTVSFEKVTGTEYTLSKPLAAGEYYWSVQAYNADGVEIAESGTLTFKVE